MSGKRLHAAFRVGGKSHVWHHSICDVEKMFGNLAQFIFDRMTPKSDGRPAPKNDTSGAISTMINFMHKEGGDPVGSVSISLNQLRLNETKDLKSAMMQACASPSA